MDVGAITRFLHCVMWVQLLGFYIVGAIDVDVQLLGFCMRWIVLR